MTDFDALERDSQPDDSVLPLMSLREVVMFPRSIVPLFVGREASIKAIESAIALHDKHIFLVTQRTPEKEKPEAGDLFAVGTVSRILQMLRLPDGTIKVLFEGAVPRQLAHPGNRPGGRRRLPHCARGQA
jgi:ATP-dependent Lon protease, bacterial type